MTKAPETRHMFQGPAAYRVFLLVIGVMMAVFLVFVVVLDADKGWVNRLCSLAGVMSASLLAYLAAMDIFRPQVLTRDRMMTAMKALVAIAAISITLFVVGFFV